VLDGQIGAQHGIQQSFVGAGLDLLAIREADHGQRHFTGVDSTAAEDTSEIPADEARRM
jgi:hypothetical protein